MPGASDKSGVTLATWPLWRARERPPAPGHKEKPRFFRRARRARHAVPVSQQSQDDEALHTADLLYPETGICAVSGAGRSRVAPVSIPRSPAGRQGEAREGKGRGKASVPPSPSVARKKKGGTGPGKKDSENNGVNPRPRAGKKFFIKPPQQTLTIPKAGAR